MFCERKEKALTQNWTYRYFLKYLIQKTITRESVPFNIPPSQKFHSELSVICQEQITFHKFWEILKMRGTEFEDDDRNGNNIYDL